MISVWWLLLLFPVSWIGFFLGVALCNSSWADDSLADRGKSL